MLISPAYAQGLGGAQDMFGMLLPLVAIFAIFYFLLIRPQQKRAKEHKAMLANIRRGDQVVTNGGLLGSVSRVVDEQDILQIEIAEGIKVNVRRGMVSEVLAKPQPLPSTGKPAKAKGRGRKARAAEAEDAAGDGAAADGADDGDARDGGRQGERAAAG